MSFKLRPDQVAGELVEFNEKLANGLQNMLEVGEISEGVTGARSSSGMTS
jgi:polyhydroxyalkanoate synthase